MRTGRGRVARPPECRDKTRPPFPANIAARRNAPQYLRRAVAPLRRSSLLTGAPRIASILKQPAQTPGLLLEFVINLLDKWTLHTKMSLFFWETCACSTYLHDLRKDSYSKLSFKMNMIKGLGSLSSYQDRKEDRSISQKLYCPTERQILPP